MPQILQFLLLASVIEPTLAPIPFSIQDHGFASDGVCQLPKKIDLFEPRLLVLIIASDNEPVFIEDQNIWRSYMHTCPAHVEAYFVKHCPHLSDAVLIDGDTIWVKGEESIRPGILHKTLAALKTFSPRIGTEFTHVLRTNLSSFFSFPRLIQFLKYCPRNQLYTSGGLLTGHVSPLQKEYFGLGSGCGFILTPDLVKLLIAHESDLFQSDFLYDDVCIGLFLHEEHKVPCFETSRMDLQEAQDLATPIPLDLFHFRIKNGDPSNRLRNERYLFKKLLKKFYNITQSEHL